MVCQGTAKCGASPSATCSSLPMSTALTNCGPLAERQRAVDTIIRNHDRVATIIRGHQIANLGVRSSNLFGRANVTVSRCRSASSAVAKSPLRLQR